MLCHDPGGQEASDVGLLTQVTGPLIPSLWRTHRYTLPTPSQPTLREEVVSIFTKLDSPSAWSLVPAQSGLAPVSFQTEALRPQAGHARLTAMLTYAWGISSEQECLIVTKR